MRILIDCDNVLCSFTAEFLIMLSYTSGRYGLREEQVKDFDFKSVATSRELALTWKNVDETKEWCASLPALSGIDHQLRILRSAGHEVVAVTAPRFGPYWMYERAKWLDDHGFGKDRMIFTHAKHCVTGDVFIDDSLENVQKWTAANPTKLCILVDKSWNQKVFDPTDVWVRVADLKEAVDLIAGMR
jgi:5'(3')-deoxyribonucleotidase